MKLTYVTIGVACGCVVFVILWVLFLSRLVPYMIIKSSNVENFNKAQAYLPIDAVYAWVDTSDQKWIESRNKHVGEEVDSFRYAPTIMAEDELELSLILLFQNAPWIRRVYIITCNQTPKCIRQNPALAKHAHRIHMVNHEKVIPHECLPVFHAYNIEQGLHKIEGLSENFIYLNDDLYITQPVEPYMFFTVKQSRLVPYMFVNERETILMTEGITFLLRTIVPQLSKNLQTMMRSEKLSQNFTLYNKHVPCPLTKTMLRNAAKKYAKEWQATACCPYKEDCELQVAPIPTAYSLALKENNCAVPKNNLHSQFFAKYALSTITQNTIEGWDENPPYFICLNDATDRKELESIYERFVKSQMSSQADR